MRRAHTDIRRHLTWGGLSKLMDNIIWLIIMVPVSLLFTGIGIYAWRRRKPMWFWSGSTVKESEISDIAAYNRANGIMWLVFSFVMWISDHHRMVCEVLCTSEDTASIDRSPCCRTTDRLLPEMPGDRRCCHQRHCPGSGNPDCSQRLWIRQ